jgi:hypothetical protein
MYIYSNHYTFNISFVSAFLVELNQWLTKKLARAGTGLGEPVPSAVEVQVRKNPLFYCTVLYYAVLYALPISVREYCSV